MSPLGPEDYFSDITDLFFNDTVAQKVENLPHELLLHIFSYLNDPRDLINAGLACKKFMSSSEDTSLWVVFYNKILDNNNNNNKDVTQVKAFSLINNFLTFTKKNPEHAIHAHIMLSRIGMSTLDNAIESIKITFRKSLLYYSFYDKCYPIALEFLKNDNLLKAEEILINMVRNSWDQSNLAFKIMDRYLMLQKFDRPLEIMRNYIDFDSFETIPTLSRFIWATKGAKNSAAAFEALEIDFRKIQYGCVRDLNEYFLENEELENSQKLHSKFPEAFDEKQEEVNQLCDVRYYACNKQIDRAIKIANLFSKSKKRLNALKEIKKIIKYLDGKENDLKKVKDELIRYK